MNRSVRTSVFLAGLSWSLLLMATPATAGDGFRYPEGRHGKGELRYLQGVPVLTVAGTPQEIGEQIGVLALKPAARIQDCIRRYTAGVVGRQTLPVLIFVAKSLYQKFPQRYREELEAMADAAKVDQDILILGNVLVDLQEMAGCSSLLVGSNRSATGAPLYGRNLDVAAVEGLAELSLVIVYRPVGQQAFALTNLPGFLMFFSGLNASGLALGSQSTAGAADGSIRFNVEGLASAVAGRRLIEECRSADDVDAWLRKNPLARGVAIAVCDCERQAVFEVTTKTVAVRQPVEGICCATNHFRSPELATFTACPRYDALERSRAIEQLSVADVGRLLHTANQGRSTIHTMVFEPKPRRLHVSMGPGPSSARPLATIDLADLLRIDKQAE